MQEQQLFVAPTPLAAPDWPTRLAAVPGVRRIHTLPFVSCPPAAAIITGIPPPDASLDLTANQIATYVRITFARPTDQYDAALDAMSNLGLRLADPCYEQAQPASWHAMGQEHPFASSHSLVVAPTLLTSRRWQDQVRATPGVVAIDAPFATRC